MLVQKGEEAVSAGLCRIDEDQFEPGDGSCDYARLLLVALELASACRNQHARTGEPQHCGQVVRVEEWIERHDNGGRLRACKYEVRLRQVRK